MMRSIRRIMEYFLVLMIFIRLVSASQLFDNLADEVIGTEQDGLMRAQCMAQCLYKYGLPKLDNWQLDVYDFYRPKYGCDSDTCKQCHAACLGNMDSTNSLDSCPYQCSQQRYTHRGCLHGCEMLNKLNTSLEKFKTISRSRKEIQINHVTDCCQSKSESHRTGESFIYLRWNIDVSSGVPLSWQPHLSFVLEVRYSMKGQVTAWKRFLTFFAWLHVTVTVGMETQYRVTPVLQDGVAGSAYLTDWILVHYAKDRDSLLPPENVTVTEQEVQDNEVFILVEWQPSNNYKTCIYSIALLPHSMEAVATEKTVTAVPEMKYWVGPLAYGTLYTVSVASCTSSVTCTQRTTSTTVTTTSCLNATEHNLNICAPQPPSNVTARVHVMPSKAMTSYDLTCDVTIQLSWSPHSYNRSITHKGYITGYTVNWDEHSAAQTTSPHYGSVQLAENISSYTMRDMKLGTLYYISLYATSPGGKSETWTTHINTTKDYHKNCTTGPELQSGKSTLSSYLIPTMILMLSMFLSAVLVYYCRRKHLNVSKTKSAKKTMSNPLYCSINDEDWQSMLQDDEHYNIQMDNVQLLDELGEGAFGKVFKAQLANPPSWLGSVNQPKIVAVKMVKDFSPAEQKHALLREIQLMKTLGRHDNIVSIVGCVMSEVQPCLLMDYCAKGDLRNYLRNLRMQYAPNFNLVSFVQRENRTSSVYSDHNNTSDSVFLPDGVTVHKPYGRKHRLHVISSQSTDDSGRPSSTYTFNNSHISEMQLEESLSKDCGSLNGTISEKRLLSFAHQIAGGMEYLSLKKFVHRDLAARNILVSDDDVIKISDFGLSRDIYENSAYRKSTSGKLPIKWMSLEAIFDQVYTTKSDVWSFGVVLWEIVTLGGSPYPGVPSHNLFQLLKEGYRMERPDNCGQQLYSLMLSTWHPMPTNRPTFTQCVDKLQDMTDLTRDETGVHISFNLASNRDYYVSNNSSSDSGEEKAILDLPRNVTPFQQITSELEETV